MLYYVSDDMRLELNGVAIGERIRFFRNLRGMTQKYLGLLLGFPERSADVRMAQYETGTRTPKADLTSTLANTLDVSPRALSVPDIESHLGLMHTLFALEDMYGLKVDEWDDDVCLRIDLFKGDKAAELHKMLYAWQHVAAEFKEGKISKEEYDQWRYHYPEFDSSQRSAKVVSPELSDMLLRNLEKKEE